MDHSYTATASAKSVEQTRQIESVVENIERQAEQTAVRVKSLLNRLRGPQPEPTGPGRDAPTAIHRSLVDRTEGVRSELTRIADMLNEVETLV
jgi:hypothetical protein